MPTLMDIHHCLLNPLLWAGRDKTVDGPNSGDPNRPVKMAAVCWYPCATTCRKARDQGHAYHAVYEISSRPLRAYASHAAGLLLPLGADRVQVMGNPDRTIGYVGLGVGCIGPDLQLLRHGAEACIMCYDDTSYRHTREMLFEAGSAILAVDHGATELQGMRQMCFHPGAVFPTVPLVYLEEHPRPGSVSAPS